MIVLEGLGMILAFLVLMVLAGIVGVCLYTLMQTVFNVLDIISDYRQEKVSNREVECGMSHATGEVIQDNKVAGYFEWNGTSEQLWSCQIWNTLDEVEEHWREGGDWKKCTCGGPHEDALLFTEGYYWPVKICPSCRVITTNRDMNEVDEISTTCVTCGKEKEEACFDLDHETEWPREGHPIETAI